MFSGSWYLFELLLISLEIHYADKHLRVSAREHEEASWLPHTEKHFYHL